MTTPLKILVLEDSPADAELLLRELRRAGFESDWLRVETEADYLTHLHAGLDLILSDFSMPQFDGLRALKLLKERRLDIPFIVISGTMGEDTAVEAMRLGATDYLMKDRLTRLGTAIRHALEQSRLRKERQAARETLRLREIALNAVSQGVLISDENRLIIYANSSFTRVSGYAESEILGRKCSILQGTGSDPETILKMRAALDAGEAFEGEILNYRKDGQPFWNDVSISPIPVQKGDPLRFIGIQRDVTPRKEAEEALRRQETELRILFDLMPAMIWFKDTENHYLRVNKRAAESIGRSAEEFEGKPARNFYPEEVDATYAADLEVIRSGIPKLGIIEAIPGPNGDQHWVQTDKVPYCDRNGKVIGLVVMAQDITNRKRAEEALRESEERFAGAFENAPIGMALVSPEGRWTKVNRAICEVVGYAEAELLARKFQDITHPDDLEIDLEKMRQLLAGKIAAYQLEKRYIHAGGYFVPVMINVSLVRDGHGLPLYFVAQIQDITERKRAQEELLWKTAFLEAQVSSSLDATIVVNDEGRKIFQNQQAVDIFKIPPHIANDPDDRLQVRWVTDATVNPEEFADKVRYLYAHPEEIAHDEIALKDGKILDRYSFPVVGRDGRYYGRTWTFRDISERKRSEDHLRLVAERLRLATEASQVGIWEFDVATQKLEWDSQMRILHGLPTHDDGDLIEQAGRSIHPEDRARLISAFNEALRCRAHPLNTEFRIVRANDGCERILRSMATVIWDGSDQPQRMIGTNWDVTEERTRERKLSEALAHEKELSEKARAGDRAKGDFLAVMSHEIRTPLNGILGFSELLAKLPELPREAREYVETISSSGESLLRILNDVLDYSRLEAGLVQVEKTGFTPREILGDIHSLLSQQARHKGLAFGVSIDENIPEKLTGDPGRLRQILINLAGNALKFTESGSVTMGLRPMADAASYEFYVRDTGCGISPGDIERIFQPFTQADSSISRRHGGSGLGLSISRRLAQLMGGVLTVQSRPGEGSEFILSLNLGEAAGTRDCAPTLQILDSSFAAGCPLRILIVEDDSVNLKLMLNMIRRLGYEPLAAKNGVEAVEIQRRESADCVLMDLQMPEMGGIEATAAIRSLEKSSHGRKPAFISAVTANIVPADRQRCFDAGMNGYLNKPMKLAALASLLTEAAGHVMRP